MERLQQGHTLNLDDEVCLAVWPTPAERDYRYPNRLPYQDRGGGSKGEQLPNVAAQVVGWTTPTQDDTRTRTGKYAQGGTALSMMAGWTTPQAHDAALGDAKRWKIHGTQHGDSNLNDEAAMIVGWKTPLVPSGDRVNPKGTTLQGRRPDGKKVTVDLREEVRAVLGTPGSSSDPTPRATIGALNPAFVSWLMGFPIEYLNYAPSAMPSRRRLPRKS
jgi:hypothetical protein